MECGGVAHEERGRRPANESGFGEERGEGVGIRGRGWCLKGKGHSHRNATIQILPVDLGTAVSGWFGLQWWQGVRERAAEKGGGG